VRRRAGAIPIATDATRAAPSPHDDDVTDQPDEENALTGSFGWEVNWWNPPTGLLVYVRVRMLGFGPGGTINGTTTYPVFIDPTPPIPITLINLHLRVSGVVTFPVSSLATDLVRFDLAVKEDPANARPKKFDQEGLGSEKQGSVGEDGANGNNNFCGPTAAKNALHRLAEADNRIYIDETAATKNLDMAKKLADKMDTDEDEGTQWPNFVGGIRDYLDEQGVGCTKEEGYTVTEYIHEYTRDDNGTPGDDSDDFTRPTKSKFSWDDYEKEMRNGEAVSLLLVPWNSGDDDTYGTEDDEVGYGHYVTGKDGEKDANAAGNHDFSFVDPGTGTAAEIPWEDRGGYPSVTYREGTWLVAGFVAVSPKKHEDEKPKDSQPATIDLASSANLTWDTRTVLDGYYLLSFYGIDADGNAAKTTAVVEVRNQFRACPGEPGLPDTDGDEIKDPCDNCPLLANFDQADLDGDGEGDLCDANDDGDARPDVSDCAPFDASLWSKPSDVANLRVAATKIDFSWNPPVDPGSLAAPQYDLLRAIGPAGFLGAVCVAQDVVLPAATDVPRPASGAVFFYLARAENVCGGTLGNNSAGIERTGRTCP